MMLEDSDAKIIEQLIIDKMPMAEIAEKYECTRMLLKEFCLHHGIKMPKNTEPARLARSAVERGKVKSETVQKIIKMHKHKPIDFIAKELNRSKDFVIRMIDIHVAKDHKARHERRHKEIISCAKRNGISIEAACAMLDIRYGQYCYSARVLGLHGHKKAPQ